MIEVPPCGGGKRGKHEASDTVFQIRPAAVHRPSGRDAVFPEGHPPGGDRYRLFLGLQPASDHELCLPPGPWGGEQGRISGYSGQRTHEKSHERAGDEGAAERRLRGGDRNPADRPPSGQRRKRHGQRGRGVLYRRHEAGRIRPAGRRFPFGLFLPGACDPRFSGTGTDFYHKGNEKRRLPDGHPSRHFLSFRS